MILPSIRESVRGFLFLTEKSHTVNESVFYEELSEGQSSASEALHAERPRYEHDDLKNTASFLCSDLECWKHADSRERLERKV